MAPSVLFFLAVVFLAAEASSNAVAGDRKEVGEALQVDVSSADEDRLRAAAATCITTLPTTKPTTRTTPKTTPKPTTKTTPKPTTKTTPKPITITTQKTTTKAAVFSCTQASCSFTADEYKQIVDRHNKFRSDANVENGKNIPNLKWNSSLAQLAQNWTDYLASVNDFSHGYLYLNGARVGQNLYMTSVYGSPNGVNLDSTVKSAAVDAWNDEKSDYDYNSNSCTPNAVCGHYTQVVWGKSLEVGCGSSFLVGDWGPSLIVCCDYYPPGNYVGQKPF